MLKSCLIIAGEKSGEEHAMSFFPELKALVPDFQFFGVGGDELKGQGVELLYHLKDFSTAGFSEVIQKYSYYKKAFGHILDEVDKRECKHAILIDFQTFNLKLARKLKKRGVKVFYYVAPQAWVWKEKRTQILADCVNTLFCIIPFEKKWFKDRGVSSISIEHPVIHRHAPFLPIKAKEFPKKEWTLLLLPGSRKFEVEQLLPRFVETVKILKKEIDLKVILVKVNHIPQDLYEFADEVVDEYFQSEDLEKAMLKSDFALAASGTVTLSLGVFALPTIVCYRVSLFNVFIFHTLIKYQGHISLTNIIHDKKLFPELKQDEIVPVFMAKTLLSWTHKEIYQPLKEELLKTQKMLTGEGINVPRYLAQNMKESHG